MDVPAVRRTVERLFILEVLRGRDRRDVLLLAYFFFKNKDFAMTQTPRDG